MFADLSFWCNGNAESDYSELKTIEELHPAWYARPFWKRLFILLSTKFYSKTGTRKPS